MSNRLTVLSLVSLVPLGAALGGCGLEISGDDAPATRVLGSEERVVEAGALADVTVIQIASGSGALSVVGDPDATDVRIEIVYRGEAADEAEAAELLALLEVAVTVAGDTLVVATIDVAAGAIDLAITVPASVHLAIADGSGNLEVLYIQGDVRIEDGSGDIRVSKIGGALDLADGSGDVYITEVIGEVLIADGSGSLSIEDAGAAVTVMDGEGDIELRLAGGAVLVLDGSGEVTIEDVSGEVTVEDGSGGVVIDRVRDDVSVIDGSEDIRVTTISGNVTITDGSGDIVVTDVSGDLDVSADGSGEVEYSGVGGQVTLRPE